MGILQRYVLAELLKVFLVSLTVITLIMVLVGIYRVAHEQGLEFAQVMPLIPYLLPDALRFSIPGTILFATCSVYGRLAATNELIAIKALGISPAVVLWPALWFTVALSLATVWLNDAGISWGHNGVQRIVIAEVEEIAYSMLRSQRSYSSKNFCINITKLDGRRMIKPVMTFAGSGDSQPVTIRAQEATLRSDLANNTLVFECTNGNVDEGPISASFSDTHNWTIPLDDASRMSKSNSPAYLPMSALPAEAVKHGQMLDFAQQRLAATTTYDLLTGGFDALAPAALAASERAIVDETQYLNKVRLEPPRRWAGGFSCICFALLGAPMAIRRRNADFLSSFFACFLPILLLYYPLLMYGLNAAKNGSLPPICAWMGNVLLAVLGSSMLRKVFRY